MRPHFATAQLDDLIDKLVLVRSMNSSNTDVTGTCHALPTSGAPRETLAMQDQALFKDVMERVGCDVRRAEGLTFAVFQELRDRITPQEAMHVAAQLPKRLKMMWMSLERPDRKVHRVNGEQFIWEVRRMAGLTDDAEA